ncbi:MAG TPA: hypothetical protein VFL66_01980 [Gaiellaceae bacterium]|nr:hypothetical protein [Gaiellaceae bacterium]
MRPLASAAALAGLALVGGCGGGSAATTSAVTATRSTTAACTGAAKVRRHVARVPNDLAAVRRAARADSHAATSRATDRLLLDLGYLPPVRRNRVIDEAAATVTSVCEDCFQALEAMRPIPSLKYGSGTC